MLAQWFRLLRMGDELWCRAVKEEIEKMGGIIAIRRKLPTGKSWSELLPCIRMIIEALISIGNWTPKDEFVWGNKNLVSLEPEYSRLARNGYLRVCDFVDADGRIREAREINLSFAQRLEWVRVTAAIRKTFTSALLVHEETRENDVTSFRWAVGEKRIEKTELDTKKHYSLSLWVMTPAAPEANLIVK